MEYDYIVVNDLKVGSYILEDDVPYHVTKLQNYTTRSWKAMIPHTIIHMTNILNGNESKLRIASYKKVSKYDVKEKTYQLVNIDDNCVVCLDGNLIEHTFNVDPTMKLYTNMRNDFDNGMFIDVITGKFSNKHVIISYKIIN